MFLLALVVFSLAVFHVLLMPGAVLFTTDDNIGALAMRKSAMPASFAGWWNDTVLAGMPEPLAANWTNLLLFLLPVRLFANWIHAIDLVLASLFLGLFLRERGQRWAACAVGALAAFWVGSNFTLTYAGHIGKFGLLVFAAAALWLTERGAKTLRWEWWALAGGAVGGMFLEQADVALFVSLALGPYAVYAIVREHGFRVPVLLRALVPMAVAAGLISFRPLWTGYQTAVKGVATMNQETPRAKWEFVTQWSWPPEESIDFIAPGFMGWRSGEPAGPYWGRMGRSAGWEQTRKGFQNFKLENQYLGAIPLAFAVWALVAAWGGRRRGGPGGADVAFWSAAAGVSLLLSFGKYFPLYRAFYLLPMVSSIRNPNKFLHVFQIAVGVLAAYGFTAALAAGGEDGSPLRARARLFVKGLLAACGLFALGALIVFASWGSRAAALSQAGFGGPFADVIVQNRVWALGHGAVLLLCAAALFWVLVTRPLPGRGRLFAAWAAVLIVAADGLFLARHYVSSLPSSLIGDNPAVEFLRKAMGNQRAALVSQDRFYNAWLTYLFPYHGIKTVNVTQMPRMPADYQAFLGAVGNQPVRLWELTAATYILGPAQLWTQIQQDAAMRELFEIAFAYNVGPDETGTGFRVFPATPAEPGRECILRLKAPAYRHAMVDAWRVVPDDEALKLLASPRAAAYHEVLVAPETAAGLPASAGHGAIAEVMVPQCSAGRMLIRVSTERAAILRISERYDRDWRATVDGRPAPLLRCDYLFQGVLVEPGLHEILLVYRPSLASLGVQALGMLVCAAALGMVFLRRSPA